MAKRKSRSRKAVAKTPEITRARNAAAAKPAAEPKPAAPPTPFRLTGRISAAGTGAALPGVRVEAIDKDLQYDQRLGSAYTDGDGRYAIAFTSAQIGKAEKGGPDIVVRVFDREGSALGESEMRADAPAELTIDVAIAQKEAPTLQKVAAELGLHLPPAFLSGLARHGVRTLADIRRVGGLDRIEGLGVETGDALSQTLDAHAELSVLPSDPATNAAVIEAGYASLVDIAASSRDDFAASLGESVGAREAEVIHAAAAAQTAFLANVIADARAGTGSAQYAVMARILPPACGCESCSNAISPMAYLADLLDYALRHLKNNGAAVTLTFLESRFHQPFRDLPATCELMEKRLRQVRICIEVLRKHLPAPYATAASQAYLESAYAALLQNIGTSFDEVRQMRSVADPAKRREVADRLGIRLNPNRALPNAPDELDRLFLDTDLAAPANPGWPWKLSEARLEQLFGLRDTKRPPLDPDVEPEILAARMHFLRSRWHEEDRSATPPLGETPIIDPDLVGEADLADATPNATPNATPRSARPRSTWSALDFLEDRRTWIAVTTTELDQTRRTSSLTQLLDLLQTNVFLLGATGMEGITVPVLLRLRGKKQTGTDIAPLLLPLRLEEDAFDYLSHIAELDRNNDPILDSEWAAFYSIVVGRVKKYVMYAGWRNEEARNPAVPQSGITLSPDHFRVRPSALAGGVLEWAPRPWRSSAAARRRWEDTLRARIEQEQSVLAGLRQAVEATEDAVLVALRDELRIAAGIAGTLGLRTADQLTGYLQIDMEAGGCQTTTRVAQAIETVQGLLFGARNGLLEDAALTLDADGFDEDWQWIGSYASWRAAMHAFLYPENTLRPTLRRIQSQAFMDFVKTCRLSAKHLSAAGADAVAAEYAAYFTDVCSLRFEALAQSFFPLDKTVPAGQWPGSYFLVVARGSSGALYYCLQDMPPYWWLTSGYRRTIWNPIPGVDPAALVRAIVPYSSPNGWFIALEVAVPQPGSEPVARTFTFDGSAWSRGGDGGLPTLFCSANVEGAVIRSAPGLASGVAEWRLSSADRMALLDVDGDGRKELVLVADMTEPDHTRRIGLVREASGGLVLDRVGFLPAGWDLARGDPVVLRMALVQSPSRRRERLVLLRTAGAQTDLGLAGEDASGNFGLLFSTTTGTVAQANGQNPWTIQPDAQFRAADLDGDGYSELVALNREHAVTDFRGTVTVVQDLMVLRARETGFTLLGGSSVSPVQDWVAARDSVDIGRDVLIIHRSGRVYPTGPLQAPTAQVLTGTALAIRGSSGSPRDDRLLPVDFLPGNAGQELLRTSVSGTSTTLVTLGPPPPVSVPVGGGPHPAPAPDTLLGTAWQTDSFQPAEAGSAVAWKRQSGDRFVAADLDGDGAQELLVVSADARLAAIIGRGPTDQPEVRQTSRLAVQSPGTGAAPEWRLTSGARYLAGDIDGDGSEEIVVFGGGRLGVLRGVPRPRGPFDLGMRDAYGPSSVRATDIVRKHPAVWPPERQAQMQLAYDSNTFFPGDPDVLYLDEAYFFVPMELGLRLLESGDYPAALDWFRSVYDYERAIADRKICPKLVLEAGDPDFQRSVDWLLDPLDPHAIAATRRNSYTKFTILSVVRCLIEFADSEFTRATPESIPRARELYLTALALLEAPELDQGARQCRDLIGELVIQVGDDEAIWTRYEILDMLSRIASVAKLAATVKQVQTLLATGDDAPARLRQAQRIAAEAVHAERAERAPTLATLADGNAKAARAASRELMSSSAVSGALERIGSAMGRPRDSAAQAIRIEPDSAGSAVQLLAFRRPGSIRYVPAPSLSFCIPPNPVIETARSHAELCLHKIRTCRNIAGMELHLEPYAVPTAAGAGLQAPGIDAPLSVPSLAFQPLPYRYSVLIERTRQLVELARQMEGSMLAFLASADQEKYQELKARQDLALTQAGVRLKDLQLTQADDGVAAAHLQRDRAQMQVDTYRQRIDQGLSDWETAALVAQTAAVVHLHTAAAITEAFTLGIGGIGEVGGALSATSQLFQMQASFERREQEWFTEMALAEQDVRIGQQQVRLAQDQVRVAAQERAISALQVQHAEQVLDFLTNKKFTSFDLYEWMSGVMEQIYRFFLQQATSMAQLAEKQLAFERQEIPATFIQADYWEPPSQGQSPDFTPPGAPGQGSGLRGLTGSARLLRDVYELDQYAFLKNQRKLQLSETISLSQLDPFAFERFRDTGVLFFSTPSELFDRKFPGHYLRLVKRVRTSVIALIPPTQGIRATLSTTGTSHAVIGNETFDEVTIQRGPETTALSSPMNATGLFELDPQPELLVPFEGIGVDGSWEFRLPKAANLFDYRTLADVLVTIEYTALDSPDYRQQVLGSLDRRTSVDRSFSFRQQFPDQWYDLHNPDQATPPAMTVRFTTERDDFPPNLEDDSLGIQQVVLYFARSGGQPFTAPLASTLQFVEKGSGAAVGGTVSTPELARSTRRGNAVAWMPMLGKSPVGDWTLALPTDTLTRSYFDTEQIEDILLVITYSGQTPKWPA